jgi:ankyrin repeat protein
MLFQAITQNDDIIAKMLLSMSDVNRLDLDLRNAFSQTPLSVAAQWGRHGIVKLLLATSLVNTDARDSQGLTHDSTDQEIDDWR